MGDRAATLNEVDNRGIHLKIVDLNEEVEGHPVHALAVGDDTGTFLLGQIRDRYIFTIQDAEKVNTSGDNTIATPAAGKAFRLVWIGVFSSEGNTAEVEVEIRLGADRCFLLPMGAPYAFAHRSGVLGPVDGSLIANLSVSGQDVYVNYELEEVTV